MVATTKMPKFPPTLKFVQSASWVWWSLKTVINKQDEQFHKDRLTLCDNHKAFVPVKDVELVPVEQGWAVKFSKGPHKKPELLWGPDQQ